MIWKNGPLPPDTWNWGGVVTADSGNGFFFADFYGDHVVLCPGDKVVKADEILMYSNCLTLPPNVVGRALNPGENP